MHDSPEKLEFGWIPEPKQEAPQTNQDELPIPSEREIGLELTRRSLLRFTKHTLPGYRANWHHKALAGFLERVASGETRRAMVHFPPQHGKSELASKRFPAWVLGRNPNETIIAASYGGELAKDNSREVKRIMAADKYRELFPNVRPAGLQDQDLPSSLTRWQAVVDTARGPEPAGTYACSGVGGVITGRGGTLLILDDPIKNQEQADSEAYREHAWTWWQTVFLTRARGDETRILVICTRWHEDDVAARILEQGRKEGVAWDVLSLPAVLDEEPHELDPRGQGDPLWPQQFSAAHLEETRKSIETRRWESLYQQRPTAPGGNIFKDNWWQEYDEPPDLDRAAFVWTSWDCTFKERGTSWVVGMALALVAGRFYVLDVRRGRWGFRKTCEEMKALARAWPQATEHVVEDKANGPAILDALADELPGLVPYSPKGSKTARAWTLEPMARNGRIWIQRNAAWAPKFKAEFRQFPRGKDDDQVDALSQGIDHGSGGSLGWLDDLAKT